MSKKTNPSACAPALSSEDFNETRTAAAAWLYALNYEPKQEFSLLEPLLAECFPQADMAAVKAIVKRQSPYEDITDELVDEILNGTHIEGYEILPWREAAMRILIIVFMSSLKTSSVQLTEETITRITAILDDRLRGTSKNACQLISGQRTRIRKAIRTLVLAEMYLLHYKSDLAFEQIQSEVMELVKPCPDPDFITDEFPFDGYLEANGSFNARGRFAFCEALKIVRGLKAHQSDLDELIQNSSKRWRISRMSLIDLNILRMAAYELCYEQQSPPRTLINEAVELAKLFGAEQSKSFVNGILQQLCNDNNIAVN